MNKINKVRKGEVRIYKGMTYVAVPEIKEDHCTGRCFYNEGSCLIRDPDHVDRKPNTGMIEHYMDYIKFMNDNVDEENKIIYDTIMMIGDASGKEGQFSDSDKKTAENFGCEYMDVDDFVYKYNNR